MNRPETDGSYKDTALYDDLNAIAGSIRAVSQYLLQVEAAMRVLEGAGMYPAPSTERLKDGKYLYLYFPQVDTASLDPQAPAPGLALDSKSRLYIGADPARIAEARRLAENTRRWRALQVWQQNCFGWLRRTRKEVANLARNAARTPNLDTSTLELYGPLGAGPVPAGAASVPNPLGRDLAGNLVRSDPNDLGTGAPAIGIPEGPKEAEVILEE